MKRYLICLVLFTTSLLFTSTGAEELTDAVFPRTDPREVGFLYQMMKVVDKEFRKHRIKYWIDFGSLLGAIRHGGIIPWDDDIDITVVAEDMNKVSKLESVLKKYGLVLYKRHPLPWKIHRPGELNFCIDIFFVWKVGDVRTFYSDWTGHWLEDETNHFARVPFGPIEVYAPTAFARRIYAFYGNDCMEKATFHSHTQDHISYKVTIVDFNPATYVVDPNYTIIPLD